jgi:hypothetical protein
MQKDDLPFPVPFEERVRFLVVLVGDLSVLQLRAGVEDIAGDGGRLVWTDLNVQIGDIRFLHAIAFADIRSPFLSIGVEIAPAFRQECEKSFA